MIAQATDFGWRYAVGDWVLTDINLLLNEGERVALIGRSGCGKSTLGLALRGIIPQGYSGTMKGRVLIDKKDTRTTPVPDLSTQVGIVFQTPDDQITQILTCHEIASGLANLCYPIAEIRERTASVTKLTGIEPLLKRETSSLSGGEKQKVALAAILAMKPKLLILDEPTTDLDPAAKDQIVDILQKLPTDQALILISHDPEVFAHLVNRLVIMDHGQIVADGPKDQVFQKPELLSQHGIAIPQILKFNHLMHQFDRRWPLTNDLAATATRLPGLPLDHLKENSTLKRAFGKEVINVDNVSFQYPEAQDLAIREVSLSVREGEMVALVGCNGAGKTTLSKLIIGLLKPNKGTIAIEGRVNNRMLGKVAYVYQNPDVMLTQSSVESEIAFTPKILGLANWQESIETSIQSMGLQEVRNRFPFTLSKGQRQKVAWAAASASQPTLLIFDEPTTGIDGPACTQIMTAIRQMCNQRKAVIFITHDMQVAFQWADRVIGMKDGRVIFDASPKMVAQFEQTVMTDLHLSLPPICQLSKRAGINPVALTPEELVNRIKEAI